MEGLGLKGGMEIIYAPVISKEHFLTESTIMDWSCQRVGLFVMH